MLAIGEVVGALHRRQAAADVGGDEVVEEHVAHRQAVRRVELVIDLADRKLSVKAARHVRRFGQAERRLVGPADRDYAQARQVTLGVLVTAEEVGLVLDQRTAEVEGVDVDVGRRLGRTGGGKKRHLDHRLALQAVAALALEGVGARRRDRVVDHAHGLAELRRVAAGHDLDFTNHHFRHRHLAQAGAILLRVVAAVHLVVDAQQRAVGGNAGHPELVGFKTDDARLQQREVVRVARGQRQGLDFLLAQRAALFDLRQIDQRRIRGDQDGLGQRAHGQPDVDHRGLTGAQRDARLFKLLEPLQLRDDAVGAERQQRRAVQAALVGDHDALVAGVDVGDSHRDAGQHRALSVFDRAFKSAVDGGGLCKRR